MKGLIAWFARNDVAANLLMVFILGLGATALSQRIPLEIFPGFEAEVVRISVPFPGAAPAEVESGVLLRIEEALRNMEGVKRLTTVAVEGAATAMVEIARGYDAREMLMDIEARIYAITTLPAEAERPTVSLVQQRKEVLDVVISGDLPERELRRLGERVRDELRALPGITQLELVGVRPYEIAIEVDEETLHRHGLRFETIAQTIANHSLDLSGGSIETRAGEILVSTRGQALHAGQFAAIPILTREDGTRLTLGEIATLRDGFAELPLRAEFDHRPMVAVEVYRVGDQSAIEVAETVKRYIEQAAPTMPPGVTLSYTHDRSRYIESRLATLANSALQGGIIIFLLLALFLRLAVAFWVVVGIPISFMGALAVAPELGVTINLISVFAFIVVLGIVVDDAIVTGENIYTHLKRGKPPLQAAIEGAQEVAVPVTFGILTTVAAFLPLFMVEGVRGQIFAQIPAIVIPVLLFSLVESKLILPAHLKHLGTAPPRHPWLLRLDRLQRSVADGFERAIETLYRPLLARALRRPWLTVSLFVAVSATLFSLVLGGHLSYTFFPRVQSETARAVLTMPPGTPFETTLKQIERFTVEAEKLRDKYTDPETGESIIRDIVSVAGWKGGALIDSHIGRVVFEIVPPEERDLPITSTDLMREWRRNIGPIPGAQEVNFRAEIGHAGEPIDIQLSGTDTTALAMVSAQLQKRLAGYEGLFDIHTTLEGGKEEIQLDLKPKGEQLGLTLADLARQVRHAFFGLEVQRIQRGPEEVRVVLRYPRGDRRSLAALEAMRIRTADGTAVPFSEVAEARLGRSPARVTRIDGRRTINVRADADKENTDLEAIKRDLARFIPELLSRYPGIDYSLEGEAREQRESMHSLKVGVVFVLFVIYALLAIPFRSYTQPLIVMSVIPFGAVGAILGHLIMNMSLSISSMLGMLALSGVVVNDSLVLVDYINRRRREGMPLMEAITSAGSARFRAIWLTSLTTFAGLLPLIFEKSTQAQFLIPMGVSLGFGILFATFITLLLVPVNYRLLDDLHRWFGREGATGSP